MCIVARRAMLRGRSIVNITEDVRPADHGTPERAISEEEALKQGMEEPSAAQRSQKSKDSSCWGASEKDFAKQKAEGQGYWSSRCQFVEKGAEVYAVA